MSPALVTSRLVEAVRDLCAVTWNRDFDTTLIEMALGEAFTGLLPDSCEWHGGGGVVVVTGDGIPPLYWTQSAQLADVAVNAAAMALRHTLDLRHTDGQADSAADGHADGKP